MRELMHARAHRATPLSRVPALGAMTIVLLVLLAACASTTTSEDGASSGSSPGSSPESSATSGTAERSTRGAAVTRPSVSGPITGGTHDAPFAAMPEALATEYGYVEEEYTISGEATAYAEAGPWGSDGAWQVEPTTTAPYTTRLLVRRPSDPTAFDGTVVVEWLNVSSGREAEPVFAQGHDELLGHGTVWVGVSAQKMGVEGGGASMQLPGAAPISLKSWDPERYGELAHPGDDYSYDIYSQAAAALLRPDGVDPLAGLSAAHLIAAGESQSAARMVTYVNAVHPVADIYDGFWIQSRSKGGSVLHADPVAQPPFAWIRDDLEVPVVQFQTETDIFGVEFIGARQPDTELLRTWEVAGTAHLDQALVDYLISAAPPGEAPPGDPITEACGQVNAGPQGPVVRRGLADLRTWIVEGTAPAHGTLIEVAGGAIARDANGIALGGIRTPPVDAPIATLSGDNTSGGGYICALFGSTVPFDAATLASLYPTHDDYVAAVTRSAEAAVAQGHLLEADAQAFIDEAEASNIGG